VDNGKTAVSTHMRVRIGLTDAPMRGPAGVSNTHDTTHGRQPLTIFDLGKFAGIFPHFQSAMT